MNEPIPFPKLADAALSLISQAAIKADDESLETVRAVRAFLRGIQTGVLEIRAPDSKPEK